MRKTYLLVEGFLTRGACTPGDEVTNQEVRDAMINLVAPYLVYVKL